jgi:hypothetical protein
VVRVRWRVLLVVAEVCGVVVRLRASRRGARRQRPLGGAAATRRQQQVGQEQQRRQQRNHAQRGRVVDQLLGDLVDRRQDQRPRRAEHQRAQEQEKRLLRIIRGCGYNNL